jgi:hypothetical protein
MRMNLLAAAAIAALGILPASGFAAMPQDHAPVDRSSAIDGQSQRATEALNLLEANGYTQFSDFRPAGSDFQATVTRNGRQEMVTIDPDSGRVAPQAATAGNASSAGYSGSSMPPASGAEMPSSSSSSINSGRSNPAGQVYHDVYNPEGGSGPTGGPEAAAAKKH